MIASWYMFYPKDSISFLRAAFRRMFKLIAYLANSWLKCKEMERSLGTYFISTIIW